MVPSQREIVERLSELSRLLDSATVEVAELDEAAVVAKAAYEKAFAEAFLTADGSMDLRKQRAVLLCSSIWTDMELAAASLRACRERIRTLGIQIEVGRTLSAATRAQFAAEATGQFT